MRSLKIVSPSVIAVVSMLCLAPGSAKADPVAVPNFSFEDGTAPGQAVGWTSNGGASSGGVSVSAGFSSVPNGTQYHFLNLPGFGGPNPSVTESNPTLIGSAAIGTYTLTVAGGRRSNDVTTDGSYVIELLADGQVIGSETVDDPRNKYAPDSWNDITAVAVLRAGDPAVGQDLTIRLSAFNGTGGQLSQGQFDHVRLDFVPGVTVRPDFRVVNEIPIPPGLTSELGDLMFSDDGNTAYFIDDAESDGAAVWTAPVERSASGTVTGFGTVSNLFTFADMDTGLEFAPDSTTFFFRAYGVIGQRTSGGATESKAIVNYDGSYGGLAFIPAQYGNGGSLLSVSYDDGTLWLHTVTDDLDGTFTIGDGTLVTDAFDSYDMGDVEYLTTGALAGSLLIAVYDEQSMAAFLVEVDQSGLPASSTPDPFAFTAEGTWGAAVDPVTGNVWLIDYDEDRMTQIAVAILYDGFESGDMTAWSTSRP